MIEKLMNPELPYGEPEYSEIGKEINSLMERLAVKLEAGDRALLEQLADLHAHQANFVAVDTYVAGFCAALDLVVKVHYGLGSRNR